MFSRKIISTYRNTKSKINHLNKGALYKKKHIALYYI